jgi:hypothetical protein
LIIPYGLCFFKLEKLSKHPLLIHFFPQLTENKSKIRSIFPVYFSGKFIIYLLVRIV